MDLHLIPGITEFCDQLYHWQVIGIGKLENREREKNVSYFSLEASMI